MSAHRRAKLDEEAGDLGLARRRLISLAMSEPFDVAVFEQIARLSVRMSDLTEAGRWYFICDSKDEVAADCMSRFVRSCGGIEHAVHQLPLKRRIPSPDAIPPAVRQRLEGTPAGIAILDRAGSKSANKPAPTSDWGGTLAAFGCLGLVILIVVLLAFGVVGLIRFVAEWW